MSQHALAGGGVSVCVYEAAGSGVIISGLQIIKFRFAVVVVATVAQWVNLGHGAGSGENLAVGVVGIAGNGVSAGIDQAKDIALEVGNVVIGSAVVIQRIGASGVIIEEVQNVGSPCFPEQVAAGVEVVVGYAVYGLAQAQAVTVVGIGIGLAVDGSGGKPSALSPGKGIAAAIVVA